MGSRPRPLHPLRTSRVATLRRPPFWPSLARFAATSGVSIVHIVPLILVSPFSRRAAWAIYRHWGRVGYRVLGITHSLRDDNGGEYGPEPHLYVWLNQSSLSEAPLFPLLLPPVYGVANVEYALMPFLGWAVVPLRFVVIVRQWKRQAKRGIERAAERLAKGERFVISIEGARSPDGALQEYKKGPVVMAIRAQATIIPCVTHGARAVLPPGEWRVRSGHIELHLLKAIPTQGRSYEDREKVLEQLRSVAEKALAGMTP